MGAISFGSMDFQVSDRLGYECTNIIEGFDVPMIQQNIPFPTTYDIPLVVLSVIIAILASYLTLELARQVTEAQGRSRWGWIAGGALAMGTGIWSMHFIGMLAFSLPIPVRYDIHTVLLSHAAAILASESKCLA